MHENIAKEKLRVIDIIRENASMVITIGGFIYVIYSCIIIPIKNLEYQVGDILNNHVKTIQDEQVVATEERKAQSEKLEDTNTRLTKIEVLLEQLVETKSAMKR